MASNATFAEVAALAGDPARAGMLHALMDGRALTASELARVAGITPQTASSHLARMTVAGLLAVEKQGRHRYHRLASPAVAQMMESIMQVASRSEPAQRRSSLSARAMPRCAPPAPATTTSPAVSASRSRTRMVARGYVELAKRRRPDDRDRHGVAARARHRRRCLRRARQRTARVLCRPCLDWSERRPHLAGAVGAALCAHSFEKGWIRRIEGTRAVAITPKGGRVFREDFGARLGGPPTR